MGAVCNYGYSSNGFLYRISRNKFIPGLFCNLEQPVIICDHASQIHRDNCLSMLIDQLRQSVIVHFKLFTGAVCHYHLGSNMDNHTCSGGICVCRYNHFISGTHSKVPEYSFQRCRSRPQSNSSAGTNKFFYFLLKFLYYRAGGYPSGFKHVCNIVYFQLTDVRR